MSTFSDLFFPLWISSASGYGPQSSLPDRNGDILGYFTSTFVVLGWVCGGGVWGVVLGGLWFGLFLVVFFVCCVLGGCGFVVFFGLVFFGWWFLVYPPKRDPCMNVDLLPRSLSQPLSTPTHRAEVVHVGTHSQFDYRKRGVLRLSSLPTFELSGPLTISFA